MESSTDIGIIFCLFACFFILSDMPTFKKRNECMSEKVSYLYALSEICNNHKEVHSDADLPGIFPHLAIRARPPSSLNVFSYPKSKKEDINMHR